ncbi:hypothetical protein [Leuconostoc lactis]|uniref:hypothetical protein n=1 Tax=Leuconostoc lactis TaxID=1246 RepID=UPI00289A3844|nr:hypothetical protein [Leuconostoc lactis]
MTFAETIERVNGNSEDENGGHGYVEHAAFGNKIVHVFYADDNEGCENNGI